MSNVSLGTKINRCGNCGSKLLRRDKYCPYCGTQRGKGKFLPESNEMCALYGPPIIRKSICANCGYKWADAEIVPVTRDYCSKCGNPGTVIFEKYCDFDELDAFEAELKKEDWK